MTNSNTTLGIYANVVNISEQMLAATKAEDWELLGKLETECASCIEKVKLLDKSIPLTKEELRLKVHYIEKILAADKEIRSMVEPWMTRLSDLMQSGGNRQKLRSAYGMHSGH